jgi:hypothetical protein
MAEQPGICEEPGEKESVQGRGTRIWFRAGTFGVRRSAFGVLNGRTVYWSHYELSVSVGT